MPPQERKVRSTAGTIIHYVVALLELVTLISGLLIILMALVLQRSRNIAGWWVIALGIITFSAPVLTIIGVRCSRLKFIGKVAVVLMVSAAIGCAAFTISLFSSRSKVLDGLYTRHNWSANNVDTFLKSVRWAFLALFIVEVLCIVLTYVNHKWIPIEYYETIEQSAQRRDMAMAAAKQDTSSKQVKVENSRAAALDTKMKQKYGKWSVDDWRGP